MKFNFQFQLTFLGSCNLVHLHVLNLERITYLILHEHTMIRRDQADTSFTYSRLLYRRDIKWDIWAASW